MIQAQFTGDKITSNSSDAYTLYEKSSFGEKAHNKIEYSPVEALFLLEYNKMQIHQKSNILNSDSLIKKLKKKDKNIENKFTVYKDMRKKGYILKTALKFGADFRVYNKGVKPGQDHAPWLLYCVNNSEQLKWHEFAAKNRVAHSTKKNLLIALIDEENQITYYQVSWFKP